MKIFKKVKDAVKETVQALDETMPPLPTPPPKPAPPKPKPTTGTLQRLGERIGFAGIAVMTAVAALAGACNGVTGTPSPRPKFGEDDPQPGYTCSYDGNGRCPQTPAPATKASCDEPAAWCAPAVTQ